MKKFFKKNWHYIALFALVLIVYFIRLVIPVISIDTEEYINTPLETIEYWYSLGRFSLGFIIELFNLQNLNIYISNLISFLLFYAGTIVFLNTLKLNQKEKFLFGAIILSSPLYAEQYTFTLQNIEIYLCYLIFMVGFVFINKYIIENKSIWWLLPAIPMIVLAFGAYQSFCLLFITLSVIYYINYYNDFDNKILPFIKYVLFFIISFGLCNIIGSITNSLLGITQNGYLTEKMNWINGNALNGILYMGYTGVQALIGLGLDFNLGFTFTVSFVIYYVVKNFNKKDKLNLAAIIFLIISPFLLSIAFGMLTFARAQFSIPFVVAFLLYYFYKNNVMKKIVYAAIIYVIVIQSISTIYLFSIDLKRYNEDIKIVNKVKKIDNYENRTIIFVNKGNIQMKFTGEILGKTFYNWGYDDRDTKANRAIVGFMNAHGVYYIKPTVEEFNEVMNDIDKYDSFINYDDKYIVINMDYYDL